MPGLDALDPENENEMQPERTAIYRRHYFLRRSIGTLYEFAVALRKIDESTDFQIIRSARVFDQDAKTLWDQAIQFFATNEELIKKVRHDIGGHFGETVAFHAVDNFDTDEVGKIEVTLDEHRLPRDPRLHFVKQIAATAMFRHLPGERLKSFEALVLMCKDGYWNAANCVQVLAALYLWPRFGRS